MNRNILWFVAAALALVGIIAWALLSRAGGDTALEV